MPLLARYLKKRSKHLLVAVEMFDLEEKMSSQRQAYYSPRLRWRGVFREKGEGEVN